MLRVGPCMTLDLGFDVVRFRNCIEFYMERCMPIGAAPAPNPELLEKRLKYCARVMHYHHFAHKDIKPANIVYSLSQGNYVLCDFGVPKTVPRESGIRTESHA